MRYDTDIIADHCCDAHGLQYRHQWLYFYTILMLHDTVDGFILMLQISMDFAMILMLYDIDIGGFITMTLMLYVNVCFAA